MCCAAWAWGGPPDAVDSRRDAVNEVYTQIRAPFAPRIIYGNDDRIEVWEEADPRLREIADAACAIVDLGEITDNGDGTYTLDAQAWILVNGFPLCDGEPFAGQPQLGFCSGWFVGDDVIVTAGHCITPSDIGVTAIVFGFRIDEFDGSAPVVVSADDVYFPTAIIDTEFGNDYDHSVVQVDRAIIGRNPAPIMRGVGPSAGTPLAAIGYPINIPTKIAGGADVKGVHGADTYFQANLDTYGGSSGSMVVNLNTYEVAGVLVRGAPDFEINGLCIRSNAAPDSGNTGGGLMLEEVSQTTRFESFVPTIGLSASPAVGPMHIGTVGGPFGDDPTIYTLRNVSGSPIDYEVRLNDPAALLLLDGGVTPVIGSLAAGATTTVTVTLGPAASALPAGVHSAVIEFDDVTLSRVSSRTHEVEVGQTLIAVTPDEPLVTGGSLGGPFDETALFLVTNQRPTAVTVRAEASETWVTINGGAGPVDELLNGMGDSTIFIVGIGPDADVLGEGTYSASVTFTNLDDLVTTVIDVVLEAGRFVSTDENLSIVLDNSFIRSAVQIDGSFCIADADVDVEITHANPADLVITLTSPEGTSVRLHDHDACDPSGRYDDEGALAPSEPLSVLDGERAQGLWSLTVVDNQSGSPGTIESWSIRLADAPGPCAPVAYDDRIAVPSNRYTLVVLDGSSRTGAALTFVVESIPAMGRLFDTDGQIILSVPHVLPSSSLYYRPRVNDTGTDSFAFSVDDGISSNVGTVDLDVGVDQPIARFDLDSDPGWTTEGGWAFGVPLGQVNDPSSGVDGSNVIGYNLAGAYPIDLLSTEYLTTTPIDCTSYAGVKLRFERWLGVENSDWDHAGIDASADGSVWTPIWENPGGAGANIVDAFWTEIEYDLSATADNEPTVRVRWGMGQTDEVVSLAGWNLDRIALVGTPPLPLLADLTTQNAPQGDPLFGVADGIVTGADLFFYVDLWLVQDPRADLSTPGAPQGDPLFGMPDGTVTGVDLQFYVNAWFAMD